MRVIACSHAGISTNQAVMFVVLHAMELSDQPCLSYYMYAAKDTLLKTHEMAFVFLAERAQAGWFIC